MSSAGCLAYWHYHINVFCIPGIHSQEDFWFRDGDKLSYFTEVNIMNNINRLYGISFVHQAVIVTWDSLRHPQDSKVDLNLHSFNLFV